MDRCGVTDPGDIEDAIRRGSYGVWKRVLAGTRPEEVVETVKRAGLRGRGGAYFQAAIKWDGARRAAGPVRYLIVNGEEGEPGIFKDRHLLEGDPHRLLEGALLAAYAAGASRLILYIHGEAHLAAHHVERALAQARAAGLVGERVLGSDFSVSVELRRGAGGFVLGEETALMESIEGRRAMPRPKPPFPTEAGVHGRPTVINNVETLFAVPLILGRGAEW
jgi:NADH:ubiquinone oxidoreductase subunit F (NADH-binding)